MTYHLLNNCQNCPENIKILLRKEKNIPLQPGRNGNTSEHYNVSSGSAVLTISAERADSNSFTDNSKKQSNSSCSLKSFFYNIRKWKKKKYGEVWQKQYTQLEHL